MESGFGQSSVVTVLHKNGASGSLATCSPVTTISAVKARSGFVDVMFPFHSLAINGSRPRPVDFLETLQPWGHPYRTPAALGAASSTLASRRNFAASSGGVGLM